MREVEFTWDRPGQLDVLARMPSVCFVSSPHSIDSAHICTYGGMNWRSGTLSLSVTWSVWRNNWATPSHIRWQDDFIGNTVCDITTVASCLADPAAIWFIDALARRPPDLLPQNSAIKAVRYLRHLRQVHRELSEMDRIPEVDVFSRLQGICRGELLQPLSPLFLPRDVHIPTVIESLHAHFFNNYILFLSDFFENLVPAKARLIIPAFNGFPLSVYLRWTTVDRDIQNRFFAAILAYTESLKHHSRSDWAVIEERLWASEILD
ncbi:hypothetical protein B0H14DRAFT_3434090 [Mycena olivaceomarginata]|nr:hypothetical protein B0H14DRAFT_3434090 [Mycena olivaceomarginata]